ncbi:GNAT family N-acetyltransferase [Arenibacter palladensis]|uniref:GNAT family N-acetyltransferase n=1 Tax=Arenibacter palladensis TaxID=237373 RepID=UPI002FD66A6A
MTKGLVYSINDEHFIKEIKNKVFLIYDVPDYEEKGTVLTYGKIDRIPQYPGYIINLAKYKDLEHFMALTFNKKSRYKLKSYKRKLESCFNIEYKMFYGQISKAEYIHIFEEFEKLLRNRFIQKGTTNNNLDPKEWTFYKEVTYPMILENRASLFVTYNEGQIIGVTLNYVQNNSLIDAITVFDIDYSQFSLGSINIMKLIEWCLENKFDKLDFSKGYYDYKKRWCNQEYQFEYHLYYNNKAILPKTMAFAIKKFFTLKQFLREKNLADKIHKLSFRLKGKKAFGTPNISYEFSEINQELEEQDLVNIDFKTPPFTFLKSIIFDFLYFNNEELKNIRVKQFKSNQSLFVILGKSTARSATIKNL